MEYNDVILADLEMENATLHDVEMLQRFIGRRYQRLQNLKIWRMTQPEKKKKSGPIGMKHAKSSAKVYISVNMAYSVKSN